MKESIEKEAMETDGKLNAVEKVNNKADPRIEDKKPKLTNQV